MSRIKLCMVTENYPPVPGGDGTYVREIGRVLCRKGFSIFVITQNFKEGLPKITKDDGMTVYRTFRSGTSFIKRIILAASFALCIVALYWRRGFDLIHVHGYIPALSFFLCSKFLKVPAIFTIHGVWPQYILKLEGRLWPIYSAIQDFLIRKPHYDAIIGVDKNSKDAGEKNPYVDKIYRIPTGVAVDEFRGAVDNERLSSVLNIDKEKVQGLKKVLFVGRLSQVKGLDFLIDSFDRLLREEKDAILMIVGEGRMRPELEERIKRKPLSEKVFFTGSLSGRDLVNVYLSADVLALPSSWEGSPSVIKEAMASGVPPVTTAVGDIPELIDENTGILVESANIDGLKEALLNLLSDENLHSKLSKSCKRKAKDYDWRKIADCAAEVYSEVLEG